MDRQGPGYPEGASRTTQPHSWDVYGTGFIPANLLSTYLPSPPLMHCLVKVSLTSSETF